MLKRVAQSLSRTPITDAEAHCDGPCGVYDPASARIAAEAVLSMTKKILALEVPDAGDAKAMAAYLNTLGRFVAIKEREAEKAKHEILVLWTDFHKPAHLADHPNIHELYWKAAKEASSAKQEVSLHHAEALLDYVKQIHELFWGIKGRDITWYTAS